MNIICKRKSKLRIEIYMCTSNLSNLVHYKKVLKQNTTIFHLLLLYSTEKLKMMLSNLISTSPSVTIAASTPL